MTCPTNYLFITEVGSRMWRMEKFASDYDLFHAFQQPIKEIMIDGISKHNLPNKMYVDSQNREIDAQYMEVGHLVHLLKKGNINAIWAVCSHVIHQDGPALQKLKCITKRNFSKSSYHSIKGMAMSELADARKRAAVRDPSKSLSTCLRTLNFGCVLLSSGTVNFTPVLKAPSEEEIKEAFSNLDNAYKFSNLPEAPDPEPFNDFIYQLRMDEIFKGATL